MKRLLVLVLCVVLVCGMVVWNGVAEEKVEYQYKVKNDGTIELSGINDTSLEIMDIPGEVDGYKVTSIGHFAFGNCSSVLTVVIPEGITAVDGHAFANAFNLESVTIPKSLVSIGSSAFRSKKLTDIKVAPDHPVYTVENEALIDKRTKTLVCFLGRELTGTYVVAPGIKKIGSAAFEFGRMSSITIPDSVTCIEGRAFENCVSLESINIPDSVTEIASSAFEWCDKLTSIQISPNHPVYECIDLLIVNKETKEAVAPSGGIRGTYVIPEGIKSIAGFSFQGCRKLDELYIPDSVEKIGDFAFRVDTVIRACTGSAAQEYFTVNTRYKFTEMSPEAFAEAIQKVKEEAANGTQSEAQQWYDSRYEGSLVCGDYRYLLKADGTAEIVSVNQFIIDGNIPAELDGYPVTSIDNDAFYSCSKLTTVVIPEGVTSLNYASFMSCQRLESVVLPSSLVSINRQPFHHCSNLKTIEVSPENPVFAVVDGALINKSMMEMIYVLDHENTGTFTVPQGITRISENVFENTSYSAILLPDSVRYIGSLAFAFCKNLTEIVLPEGLETLGNQVFFDSEKLESLTIPDSVTRIGSAIFGSNEALTTVHISPDHPAYMMLDGLLVEKGNMRIIGALNSTPAKYVIPEGIKEISFMAFQGSKDLEELTVPDGLSIIGSDAFSGCSKLRDIFLPASVTEIGYETFRYARELVIHAPAGSYAQQYAEENGYRFEAVE